MSGEVQTQATTIYCPQCGQAMRIAPEHVQVAVACPHCSHTLEPWRLLSPTPPIAAPTPGAPPPIPPAYAQPGHAGVAHDANVSPKSRLVMLLLCFFLGTFGAHRFFAGRFITGVIWFLTISLLGFGWLYDMILISCGAFRDGDGRRIVRWE